MPLALQKGFNKKRIDHRHHAMDAIIIACANRNIVNYLNNESASSKSRTTRHDLQSLLCDKVKTDNNGNYKWLIRKPWETFTQDVHQALNNTIVSFKQNLRVINKATNIYSRYENGEKKTIAQKGTNWAIRKPMHKDTVYGEINIRKIKSVSLNEAIENPSRIVEKEFKTKLLSLLKQGYNAKNIKKYFDDNSDVWQDINLSKIKVYYFTKETNDRFFATRKLLDTTFTKAKIESSIADTAIQKILLSHLEIKDNNPESAFSPDGIDEMNRNIISLNGGKFHQPILKVREYHNGTKFALGQKGNKSSKFVKTAEGTNLYFVVYETEIINEDTGIISKKRNFATIPLNIAIERLKQGLHPAYDDINGNEPSFVLSPNDLVYVPTKKELVEGIDILSIDKTRIYKFVDSYSSTANFIPYPVANIIYSLSKESAKEFCKKDCFAQNEFGVGSPQSKNQRALTGEMIKEVCIPVKVDRLGNIIKFGV